MLDIGLSNNATNISSSLAGRAKDHDAWWLEDIDLSSLSLEGEVISILPLPSNLPVRSLLKGLLDILFAYCYDVRFTCGDSGVESAWTVKTVSPTLSWFEVWGEEDSAWDVLVAVARRSLVYPYVRSVDFSRLLAGDVLRLFGSKASLLRAVMDVRRAMHKSQEVREPYYY